MRSAIDPRCFYGGLLVNDGVHFEGLDTIPEGYHDFFPSVQERGDSWIGAVRRVAGEVDSAVYSTQADGEKREFKLRAYHSFDKSSMM